MRLTDLAGRACLMCRTASTRRWLCDDCLLVTAQALDQARTIEESQGAQKRTMFGRRIETLCKRALWMLKFHRWAGLACAIGWVALGIKLVEFTARLVMSKPALTFLWEPTSVFLMTFILVALSVLSFLWGLRLGRRAIAGDAAFIRSLPQALLGGWTKRVRWKIGLALRFDWGTYPLLLVLAVELSLTTVFLLWLWNQPPPFGWTLPAWQAACFLTYLLLTLPVFQLPSGYFFGLFHHLDWLDALERRLALQRLNPSSGGSA